MSSEINSDDEAALNMRGVRNLEEARTWLQAGTLEILSVLCLMLQACLAAR